MADRLNPKFWNSYIMSPNVSLKFLAKMVEANEEAARTYDDLNKPSQAKYRRKRAAIFRKRIAERMLTEG